ncbi:hydroxyacid dehydrogenase [Chryseobacterium indologenes]|uniref:2-hydroxyacid dehydrogenase n=1 Tax=Chryseobacterium indologenes TaxID=253 RepID=UPI000F505B83|nr:2-hydroxyacid dehydrogenase [Chryseobacterium indologenes]AYZ34065.1 hydroxyacid dehydrogenase [Chryseobacterium indologenes]MBF6642575.1 2-hydroxyacid dehydrogenase [Chryseobacterium indologenes]MBU3047988.1 2-hydroxyacid dehydrogenase [Chryseobacterium indologenes]MEB4761189.1 2-hydroxyacid dehydrogenase [Chryseobacterium indologenes]QQQ69370.1 2-hydroxyacid dehydrogenase [Chryseobacterium indologenes]
MKVLLLDKNHPLITEQLLAKNFILEEDFTSSYEEVCDKIKNYDGIIIRSRIPLDKKILENGKNLKFIARVGAGMENIDIPVAEELGIQLINSPEGNRDSVAEHVVGMLLVIMNRLFIASQEVKKGIWKREENRGDELLGKTVGLIGYGNMGKATAKRLSGFGCKVIFHDILPGLADEFATQLSLEELKQSAEILSLHIPLTQETNGLIDEEFIAEMKNDFYFVNTARGKNVTTKDLVKGLKSGKVKGACLDVLEYEKSSFENLETENEDLKYLLESEKAIVTPHIAGWTHQSKEKLAQFIVDKIVASYC